MCRDGARRAYSTVANSLYSTCTSERTSASEFLSVHDFVVLNGATLVLVVKLDTLALFCRFPNLESTAIFSNFVWNVMRTRPSFPAEVSHAFL